MARTSQFTFTNTSTASSTVTTQDLGLTTNYALKQDQADAAQLGNKTTYLDAEENVLFRSRTLTGEYNFLSPILHPAKVTRLLEYSVRVDNVLVTTDTSDPTFREDNPISVVISFKHPRSGDVSATHVQQALVRALSALRRADGTWRMDDLMRSAERPVVD